MKTLVTHGEEILNRDHIVAVSIRRGGIVASMTSGKEIYIIPQHHFGDGFGKPHKDVFVFLKALNEELNASGDCLDVSDILKTIGYVAEASR